MISLGLSEEGRGGDAGDRGMAVSVDEREEVERGRKRWGGEGGLMVVGEWCWRGGDKEQGTVAEDDSAFFGTMSSSSSTASATAAWILTGTRTHAKVRSCVTQPRRSSHARICRYGSLWSLLGMNVE